MPWWYRYSPLSSTCFYQEPDSLTVWDVFELTIPWFWSSACMLSEGSSFIIIIWKNCWDQERAVGDTRDLSRELAALNPENQLVVIVFLAHVWAQRQICYRNCLRESKHKLSGICPSWRASLPWVSGKCSHLLCLTSATHLKYVTVLLLLHCFFFFFSQKNPVFWHHRNTAGYSSRKDFGAGTLWDRRFSVSSVLAYRFFNAE